MDGLGGELRLRRRARDGEGAAAVRDRHVERGFDLPQVGVERAAKMRERVIVERRERELDRLAPAAAAVLAWRERSDTLSHQRRFQCLVEHARRFDEVRARLRVAVAVAGSPP